jgi:hypothetical protein
LTGVLRYKVLLVSVAVVMTVAVLVLVGGLLDNCRLGRLRLQPGAFEVIVA